MTVDVLRPTDIGEALSMKAARPEAVPIAGGTDVMVDVNFGRIQPRAMIDLSGVAELRGWRVDGSRLFLGAGVTYTKLLSGEVPPTAPLAAASRTIGSRQIRNRATIGGNLGTASPAGDALPVLAALDAEVEVGRAGSPGRRVALADFLLGPKRTALAPEELIVGTRVRVVRGPGVFAKVGARNAMVIAIASMCLVLDEDEQRARVAVGSVGPTVARLPDVEAVLDVVLGAAGVWADPYAAVDPSQVDDIARLVEASVRPIDDARGTAAYRRRACGVLLRRTLAWALAERTAAAVPA